MQWASDGWAGPEAEYCLCLRLSRDQDWIGFSEGAPGHRGCLWLRLTDLLLVLTSLKE